jgi:hypothetical protein
MPKVLFSSEVFCPWVNDRHFGEPGRFHVWYKSFRRSELEFLVSKLNAWVPKSPMPSTERIFNLAAALRKSPKLME